MSRVRRFLSTHPVAAWVLGAIAVGLVVRWGFVLITIHFIPESDNKSYLDRATYFYNHFALMPNVLPSGRTEPDAYWPPVFPVVMAFLIELHTLARDVEIGKAVGVIPFIRLGFATLGAVTIGAVALIARRLLGARAAILAAWLAALFPPLIYVSASMYSESLFVPLALLALVATLEYGRSRRPWLLVAAGLLIGLGSLTHSDGLALLIPICIAVWAGGRLWGDRLVGGVSTVAVPGPRRAWSPILIVLAATLVLVVPWTIRNAVEFHAFVPVSTSFGNTLAGTYNATSAHSSPPGQWLVPQHLPEYRSLFVQHPVTDPSQDSALEHDGITYIKHHPGYVGTVWFWNTVRLLELKGPGYSQISAKLEGIPYWGTILGVVAFWLLLVGAVAGLFVRSLRAIPRWIWIAPVLMYLSVVFLNTETPRFRSPIDPFLVLMAAAALAYVWDRLRPAQTG